MSSINDKVDRLINRVHKKRIVQALDEVTPKHIFDKMPDNDRIYEVDELIKWINENMGIEDLELIQNGIQKLMDQNKLLSANVRGKTYLQKNTFYNKY